MAGLDLGLIGGFQSVCMSESAGVYSLSGFSSLEPGTWSLPITSERGESVFSLSADFVFVFTRHCRVF